MSLMNDAEIPRVIYDVFTKMNIGRFIIRISNRKLIIGLLNSCGIDQQTSVEVMRTIDKIEKIGEDEVRQILISIGVDNFAIENIFGFLAIKGSPTEIVEGLQSLKVNNEVFLTGITELSTVIKYMDVLGMPADSYAVDLTIARGLDYYTGTVYETVLVDYPGIGSICSGGRFDNLAEKYTDTKLPGVGISIGLTRLFSQLKDAGIIKTGGNTLTRVLVIPLVDDPAVSLEIATILRNQGIATEVYFEGGKMKKKLAYADKIGVPFVVLVGENEIYSGMFAVKNMLTRQQCRAL